MGIPDNTGQKTDGEGAREKPGRNVLLSSFVRSSIALQDDDQQRQPMVSCGIRE
jgi:hypothetical protein